jgi:translation initiation factor IF-3
LINENGDQEGVVPVQKAIDAASAARMDLVEIAPNAEPPVCKIMDWGKYRFEQQKKAQASKKKQKQVQVKEIKLRPVTDENDFQVKLRNAKRFLGAGDKVKVTLRFRGREMAHIEVGRAMLDRIEEELADEIVVEQRPKMEGRQMVMMIAPRR